MATRTSASSPGAGASSGRSLRVALRPATAATHRRRLTRSGVLEPGGVDEGAAVVVGDQDTSGRQGLVVLVDGAR
jgi:hypothetical protein